MRCVNITTQNNISGSIPIYIIQIYSKQTKIIFLLYQASRTTVIYAFLLICLISFLFIWLSWWYVWTQNPAWLTKLMKYSGKFWADPKFVHSKWETVLLCNDPSHWLGTRLGSALKCLEMVATEAIVLIEVIILWLVVSDVAIYRDHARRRLMARNAVIRWHPPVNARICYPFTIALNLLNVSDMSHYTPTNAHNWSWDGVYSFHFFHPSVCSSGSLSVHSSVDQIISALYLPQYLTNPFDICTSYQLTSEGVSHLEFCFKIAKF